MREKTSYHYDRQGNLLEAVGAEGSTVFSYNAFHQQLSVDMPDGKRIENRYDSEYLRAGAVENGVVTSFSYHNGELLAQSGREGEPISRYILGYGVAAGWNREKSDYHYYHLDEQNSTAYITGSGGEIENQYEYNAFGVLKNSREELPNRILYTGQQYDQTSGQHYLRARFYNPVIGRFVQEDEYRGDGLNLYEYCKNNPVVYYDSSGYDSQYPCKEEMSTEDSKGDTNSSVGNNALLRGDDVLYSNLGKNGIPKSYIDSNGNLIPVNPEGIYKERQVSVTEHILGGYRRGAKGNSPYTSFTFDDSIIQGYGNSHIEVDISGLRKAIQNGEVTDVEILGQKQIKKLIISDSIQSTYWKNKELSWTQRDSEYLN